MNITTGFCLCEDNKGVNVMHRQRKRRDMVSTCADKDSDDERQLYEFHKRKEINYMHVEISGDDEFLYCEQCNLDYFGDCSVHGLLHVVFDTAVPADGADPDRALHTLPTGLEVRESGIPNAGLGVWATTFFPVRSRFGPYEGRRVTDPDVAYSSGYCWQPSPDLSKVNLSDSIEEFFTKEELEKMCPYEQNRYRNIRKNHEMLKHFGLSSVKPEFMQRNKKDKSKQCTNDVTDSAANEAESDPEWLPEHETPSCHVWKSPVQSAVECEAENPAKMRKKKDKARNCTEKDSDNKPHVYEFRKRKEINYMHVEIPDDDEFLYCEECNLDYPGDCPVHGPLLVVFDTAVPADGADPDRALHTLPTGLEVRESGIPNAGLGVWATTFFPVRSRFGPYEGRRVTDPDVAYSSGYCWQIWRPWVVTQRPTLCDRKEHFIPAGRSQSVVDSEDQQSHFVDAKDCSVSNWTRYVNCARTEFEQNLTAYQHRGQIFYRSHYDIQPGTELLVWYGNDYGKELGITPDTACRSSGRLEPGDGVFPCPYCRMAFSESGYLDRHTHRKHSHLCNVSKTQRDKDSSTDSTRSCQFKGNCLFSKAKRHKKSKTDVLCDRSETRGESLTDRDSLDAHVTTDAGNRSHAIQTWGESFIQICNLNADMKTPTGETWHKGQTGTDSININRHMRKHTVEPAYKKCKTCDKTFTHSGHLNTHLRTHTGERPYKCNACDKTFTQSCNLNTHLRTHTGERPYKCKTCDKTFTLSGHLNTHMRTHTGERPYKCKTCYKTFTHGGDLNKHIRTHTGERPYKCKTCDKTFTQSSSLNTHVRRHTGERPYNCKSVTRHLHIVVI